jgi:hypothetical protein
VAGAPGAVQSPRGNDVELSGWAVTSRQTVAHLPVAIPAEERTADESAVPGEPQLHLVLLTVALVGVTAYYAFQNAGLDRLTTKEVDD